MISLFVILILGVTSSASWGTYKARLDHCLKKHHKEGLGLDEDTSILESRKAKRILAHIGFRGEVACSKQLQAAGNLKSNSLSPMST